MAELWKWDAKAAPRDPNSATMMSHWRTYAIVRPNLAMRRWAVAWATAGEGDAYYNVPVHSNRSHALDPQIRIPLGTRPDPSGDGHLQVLDQFTNREHDFFEAVYDEGTRKIIGAGGGASFPKGSVNELVKCWGGSAAQTPLKRGLILPQWIKDGHIPETMQFSNPCIGGKQGVGRYPALSNAVTAGTGRCPAHTDPLNHLAEGSWLALPPDYDAEGRTDLPAWQRTICVALRDFGMVLRDNSGSLGVYGANDINMPYADCKWESAGLSGDSAAFSSAFPWNQLQLLSPPPVA
jgi:hypothetical protein